MGQHEKIGEPYPDLEEYRQLVSECAAADDGRVIFNRSPAHAAVVLEALFRVTKSEICILSGQLFKPIYGSRQLVKAAASLLRNREDSVVKIIHEDPIDEDHPLLAAIREPVFFNRVCFFRMTPEMAKATPYHFAVADGRSFRFEPSKTTFEAVAQFGELDIGGKLKTRFDLLFQSLLPRPEVPSFR